METLKPRARGCGPRKAHARRAKTFVAVLTATVVVLGLQAGADAASGTQRFHIIYAGPFDVAAPPARTVIATGPIQGKGFDRLISEGPGPEPGTMQATVELVFPNGSVFLTFTGVGTLRFNARACIGFNTASGTWMITGGTGVYTGATGEGTFDISNTLSGRRTRAGCPPVPDRLISNLRFVGTASVPAAHAA